MKEFTLEGIQYDNYQDYCDAKRARNQRKLESLGLDKGFSKMKEGTTKKETVRLSKYHPVARRSSARILRIAPAYTGESIDTFYSDSSQKAAVKKARTSIQKRVSSSSLTPEQRATLSDSHDWLDELEHFLLYLPHGKSNRPCSHENARNVMNQVKKLVSGRGITYAGWAKGVVFEKKVSLNIDFDALCAEAQAFQDKHGHDKGNGWLLLHPIKKLKLFQQYKFQQDNEL